MSLFETINGLQIDQLASVADTLGFAKIKKDEKIAVTQRTIQLKHNIKSRVTTQA
jgi:hypothetical protein